MVLYDSLLLAKRKNKNKHYSFFTGKQLSNSTITKRSWSPSNIDIEESASTIERRMDENWREIDRKSTSIKDKEGRLLKVTEETKSMPSLYKVKLTQRGYIQFLRYIADIPPLQEYTFCLWFMSKNLTHSHPLFSYSSKFLLNLLFKKKKFFSIDYFCLF